MKYNRVTAKIAARLEKIVGPQHIIFNDADKMKPYSHDEIYEPGYTSMPEVVVKPFSPAEISQILQLANDEMIPVTPRGAGSGLSGGAVPVFGGILLSVERMNRILEIDRDNLMIVVEPGVITKEINQALREAGLFYAGYPMSMENCFIGGNVAENAGGAKAVKYGVTGNYVQGLEVVLPTGEIISLGGKRLKDVTGYDILSLMVGSEGTLGIFTRIVLKVLPIPPAAASLLIPFKDLHTAVKTAPLMMIKTGIIPAAMELMDRKAMEISCRLLNKKVPYGDEAGSFLLVEVDGQAEQVEKDYNAVADYYLHSGALEVYVADSPSSRENFWKMRTSISQALKVFYPGSIAEDIVVPPASLHELLIKANRLAFRHNLGCTSFGHLGDGNAHIHLLKREGMPEKQWHRSTAIVLEELYRTASQLGGTLSGEHGIGHKRKKHLPLVMGQTELSLLRRIKKTFDPRGILNPGKIIDCRHLYPPDQ